MVMFTLRSGLLLMDLGRTLSAYPGTSPRIIKMMVTRIVLKVLIMK